MYHDPSPLCYHWVNDPMSIFARYPQTSQAKDSRKTKRADRIEKKRDELVGLYSFYVYTVCGEASSEGPSQGHTVKWDLLKKELESWLAFHNSLLYENDEYEKNNGNGKNDEIWVGFLVSSTFS